MKSWKSRLLLAIVVIAAAMQFVRPDTSNPPIDSSRTVQALTEIPAEIDAILARACNDCHTYQTVWPWYSKVAPPSWFVARHVEEGREHLDLSDFAKYTPYQRQHKLEEIAHEVDEGEMPLSSYLPMHPEAKLSDTERQALVAWANIERQKILATLEGAPDGDDH